MTQNKEKPSKRKQYILTEDIEKSLAEIVAVKEALEKEIRNQEAVRASLEKQIASLREELSQLKKDLQSSYNSAKRQFYSE